MLESFLNKVAKLNICNFIIKTTQHRCFPVNIAKFLRIALFIGQLWWLLLTIITTSFCLFSPFQAKVPIYFNKSYHSASDPIIWKPVNHFQRKWINWFLNDGNSSRTPRNREVKYWPATDQYHCVQKFNQKLFYNKLQ